MLRYSLLSFLLLLLQACATQPPADWPAGIPSANLYRAAWRADTANQRLQSEELYLLWVTRFYLGFNGIPGWLDMTEQLLYRVPEDQKPRISAHLFDLGARISREWPKDNEVRRINTRAVATWRDALLEALRRDELNAFLDKLDSDVDQLLSQELDLDLIRFERYYIDEFD